MSFLRKKYIKRDVIREDMSSLCGVFLKVPHTSSQSSLRLIQV